MSSSGLSHWELVRVPNRGDGRRCAQGPKATENWKLKFETQRTWGVCEMGSEESMPLGIWAQSPRELWDQVVYRNIVKEKHPARICFTLQIFYPFFRAGLPTRRQDSCSWYFLIASLYRSNYSVINFTNSGLISAEVFEVVLITSFMPELEVPEYHIKCTIFLTHCLTKIWQLSYCVYLWILNQSLDESWRVKKVFLREGEEEEPGPGHQAGGQKRAAANHYCTSPFLHHVGLASLSSFLLFQFPVPLSLPLNSQINLRINNKVWSWTSPVFFSYYLDGKIHYLFAEIKMGVEKKFFKKEN